MGGAQNMVGAYGGSFAPDSQARRALLDGFHGVLDLEEFSLWGPGDAVTIVKGLDHSLFKS